jgi:hypothetical protein
VPKETDNLCYRNVYFLDELFFYIELAITEIKRQLFALLYFFRKSAEGKETKEFSRPAQTVGINDNYCLWNYNEMRRMNVNRQWLIFIP